MATKKRDPRDNLNPPIRTSEEARRLGARGGRRSGEVRRARRSLRDLALDIINSPAPPKLAAQVRTIAPGLDEVTTGAVMLAGQVNAAANGNAQAFRAVTELAGVDGGGDAGEDRPWAADMALLIGRDFVDAHRGLASGEACDLWLPGGRGSLKSSFASLEIACGLMRDPDANALVIQSRRVNLRDASMAQMLWAFDRLGVADLWVPTGSTLRINNRETGQAVVFRGCDEPKKLKSIKLRRGHWRYLWVEEADLLRGMAEVRSVRQTVSRSPVPVQRLYTFNPPRTRDSWANAEVARVRSAPAPGEAVVDSCYTDAPPEWLGEQFVADAEALRAADPEAYRHEYLGEAVGYGAEVFPRAEVREPTAEELVGASMQLYGVDWGFSQDPFCWVRLAYDPRARALYVLDEVSGRGMSNAGAAEAVAARMRLAVTADGAEALPAEPFAEVWCDSAEPKSVADFRELGVRAQRAPKQGANSVRSGVRWLQQRSRIVVSPSCRLAAAEFPAYSYALDADGRATSLLPDADNHAIDAARYAVCTLVADRRFV